MLVKDIIDRCDTGLVKGLNDQLIAKMNRMVHVPVLLKVDHPLIIPASDACNLYLQPKAATKLVRAAEAKNDTMTINSCLRTTVQQHILRQQFEKKLCGITACAKPGTSNHERGAAVDLKYPDAWQAVLSVYGWRRLGAWDYPHSDFWDCRQDIASLQMFAFQHLWNEHNPTDLIPVDGVYGNMTSSKIDRSPIDGWQ
jgi:N-acetylmuramoyl-L-alanine amidase